MAQAHKRMLQTLHDERKLASVWKAQLDAQDKRRQQEFDAMCVWAFFNFTAPLFLVARCVSLSPWAVFILCVCLGAQLCRLCQGASIWRDDEH